MLAGLVAVSCSGGFGPFGGDDRPPNVVVVMTDDQWVDAMAVMPRTEELVFAEGTAFDDALVSLPRCCPSRATFLTGQYAHNNGVEGNSADDLEDPNGGYRALRAEDTIASQLQSAGYTTAHIGKYLNGYGSPEGGSEPREVPDGWTNWYGTTDPQTYRYNAPRFNVDGRLVCYGAHPAETECDEDAGIGYSTDIMGAYATDFIAGHARDEDPFFLVVAPIAPHVENRDGAIGLPVPAERHAETIEVDEWDIVDSPAFDEDDVSDKASPIAGSARLTPNQRYSNGLNLLRGLESLVAVDELVDGLVFQLSELDLLDETVLIFTSDNGLALGDHRRTGKYYPYERSIRVPLAIRGPGFPAGEVVESPVGNVDLAPTILAAAGVEPAFDPDGVDLHGLSADPVAGEARAILLESGRTERAYDRFGSWYTGVRTADHVYLEYESDAGVEYELYDLTNDPYQLDNRVEDPGMAEVRAELDEQLERLRDCSGEGCR